jgi:hypothetical protein
MFSFGRPLLAGHGAAHPQTGACCVQLAVMFVSCALHGSHGLFHLADNSWQAMVLPVLK